jgi:hypothetical protein
MEAKQTFKSIKYTRATGFLALAAVAVCCLLFFFNAAELRTGSLSRHQRLINTDKSISGVTGSLFLGSKLRAFDGPRVVATQLQEVVLFQKQTARQEAPAAGVLGGRWAVCTTIFEPSQAILRAIALSGWSVVIVGNKSGTAFNLTAPNLVFLDVAAQQQMAAEYAGFADLLPWKHFGRKNTGYLYAIMHGAHTIWDFDDDNILKQGVEPHLPSRKVYHVAADSPHL